MKKKRRRKSTSKKGTYKVNIERLQKNLDSFVVKRKKSSLWHVSNHAAKKIKSFSNSFTSSIKNLVPKKAHSHHVIKQIKRERVQEKKRLQSTQNEFSAQIAALSEYRNATSQRFLKLAEEIGILRGTLNDIERTVHDSLDRVQSTIDIVEQISPQKIRKEMQMVDTQQQYIEEDIGKNKARIFELQNEIELIAESLTEHTNNQVTPNDLEKINSKFSDLEHITKNKLEQLHDEVDTIHHTLDEIHPEELIEFKELLIGLKDEIVAMHKTDQENREQEMAELRLWVEEKVNEATYSPEPVARHHDFSHAVQKVVQEVQSKNNIQKEIVELRNLVQKLHTKTNEATKSTHKKSKDIIKKELAPLRKELSGIKQLVRKKPRW